MTTDIPESDFPVKIVSEKDLEGTWDFVSFYYQKTQQYLSCTDDPPPVDLLTTFVFDGEGLCDIINECGGFVGENWEYRLDFPSDPAALPTLVLRDGPWGTDWPFKVI